MVKRWYIAAVLVAVWLLTLTAPICAAPVPEGFVGVPWGATQEQVIKMMSERGWREAFGDGKSFYGFFAGFPGIVTFEFTGNAMTGGRAELERATNGYNSKHTFDAGYKLLSEKYGQAVIQTYNNPDRKSSMPVLYQAEWELVDDASADKYAIMLWTSDAFYLRDGTRLYLVGVNYTNKSLKDRKKNSEI